MFAVPVTAITNSEDSNSVPVIYFAEESFIITIPAGVSIDGNTGKSTVEVSASDVVLSAGSYLNVSISSESYDLYWKLTDEIDETNQLRYIIGTEADESNIFNNSLVLSVGAGEAYHSTVTKTIYFSVIDEAIKAGTYKDILVFYVEVEKTKQ